MRVYPPGPTGTQRQIPANQNGVAVGDVYVLQGFPSSSLLKYYATGTFHPGRTS